jgi:hypothetical protein
VPENDALEAAFAPLRRLHGRDSSSPLQPSALPAEAMPQPYRALLAHENDMTQTLQTYHGEETVLKVHQSKHDGTDYLREVSLVLAPSGSAVEYGAICLHLAPFSDTMREAILDNTRPLGALIASQQLKVTHNPGPYFSVQPDARILDLLSLKQASTLYGRCNTIRLSDDTPIAQVVEILPLLPNTI